MSAPELVTVRDVYGREWRVARADLDGPRVQLPIYTASGIRLSQHYAAMNWSGKGLATTLHRENIAQDQTRKGGADCEECGGVGTLDGEDGMPIACPHCDGTGREPDENVTDSKLENRRV